MKFFRFYLLKNFKRHLSTINFKYFYEFKVSLILVLLPRYFFQIVKFKKRWAFIPTPHLDQFSELNFNINLYFKKYFSQAFSKGASHSTLQSVCTGARKHFVESAGIVRHFVDNHVEFSFTEFLYEVLV